MKKNECFFSRGTIVDSFATNAMTLHVNPARGFNHLPVTCCSLDEFDKQFGNIHLLREWAIICFRDLGATILTIDNGKSEYWDE